MKCSVGQILHMTSEEDFNNLIVQTMKTLIIPVIQQNAPKRITVHHENTRKGCN